MKNASILFSLSLIFAMMIGCSNNESHRSDELDVMDSRDTLFHQDTGINDSLLRDSLMRDSIPPQPIKH